MSRRRFAYLIVTVVLGFVVSTVGGISYTNHVDQQRRESEKAAAAARAEQSEQTRRLICDLSLRNAAVYENATTPVGVQARDVWLQFAVRFHCQ